MKKITFSLIIALFSLSSVSLTSCGPSQKTEEQENHEAMDHTCPMHPEVRGKEGETCPHCGMALEKIEQNETDHGAHP